MTGIRSSDRLGIAMIVAVALASLTLRSLTVDQSFVVPGLTSIIIVGALSIVGRRLGLPGVLLFFLQLAAIAVFLLSLGSGLGDRRLSLLPRVGHLFFNGIRHIQAEVAPMPAEPGVTWLFVSLIALAALATDLLGLTLRQVPWTIASLGLLYLIPALGPRTDMSLGAFVLLAIGYLTVLLADGINTNHAWARNLGKDTATASGADGAAARVAAAIGIPAIAITFVVGVMLPQLDPYRWDGSRPGGSGPIQLSDPSLDIRRNLNQPDDSTIITYQTTGNGGTYLRAATLPVFDHTGWHISSMAVKTGTLPGPPGAAEVDEVPRTTRIQIGDFRSEYLPLPYAPRTFDAPGSWGYDATSLVVISTNLPDGRSATRNLSYSAESVDVIPDGAKLSVAAAGNPSDRSVTAALPADLPKSITDLTFSVTKDATSPALKAAAIQDFLRSSKFTYSTQTAPGSGYQALENFLVRDRTGYCEQFATAMAAMARVVGIPSRVAIGFLPGEKNADGTWEVTKHDMHSWPELYFAGQGWVRFEPTPGQVTGRPPAWTQVSGNTPEPTASAARSSAAPSASSSVSAAPSDAPSEQADTSAAATAFPWRPTLVGTGVVLVMAVLGAVPWWGRRRLRARRLHDITDPHERTAAAWAEVRDTVRDVGQTWPAGSPRAIAAELADRLPPENRATIEALGRYVERSRYARSMPPVGSLEREVNEVRHALLHGLDRKATLRATLLPHSVVVNAGAWLSDRAARVRTRLPQR